MYNVHALVKEICAFGVVFLTILYSDTYVENSKQNYRNLADHFNLVDHGTRKTNCKAKWRSKFS